MSDDYSVTLTASQWKELIAERDALADERDALKARLAEAERVISLAVTQSASGDARSILCQYFGHAYDTPEAVADVRRRITDSAPAAPERRACTCLYPTPAKYVPDFCGMCHGRITSTAPAAPLCPYCGMPDCGYTGGECVAETVNGVKEQR